MIVAYADESGTHDPTGRLKGAEQATIGGFVGESADWDMFITQWSKVLKEYGISFLHTTEMAYAARILISGGRPNKSFNKNPYRTWNIERINDFVSKLASVCNANAVFPFGGWVNTAGLFKAKCSGQVLIGSHPYDGCLSHCFSSLLDILRQKWPDYSRQVNMVFDQTESEEWKNAIDRSLRNLRDSRFNTVTYTSDRLEMGTPLQAADLINYRIRMCTGMEIKGSNPKPTPLDRLLFKGMMYQIFPKIPSSNFEQQFFTHPI